MRKVLIAAAVIAGLSGGAADAQVMAGGRGQSYPAPGPGPGWGGGYIDGQWSAGVRAPGGWQAYRRPQRGWRMPGYWRSPEYRVRNYAAFGLQSPPQGYGWSRYYDDAVLVDDYGRVYDSVSGVDWRRVDQPYSSGYGYPSQGYANSPNGYDPRCYDRGQGSGLGGALVGGAIGAGIGAATGGLGTTLIGGGVGALAGQAIDRNSRARGACGQGAGYGYQQDYGYQQSYGQGSQSYAGDGYAYAQGGQGGGVSYAPQREVVQQTYSGGYLPGARATATVDFGGGETVTTTTTTTTTEEYSTEPVVTYAPVETRVIYRQGPTRVIYKQAPARVVYRTIVKPVPVYRAPVRKWRPKPRVVAPACADACECGAVCGS